MLEADVPTSLSQTALVNTDLVLPRTLSNSAPSLSLVDLQGDQEAALDDSDHSGPLADAPNTIERTDEEEPAVVAEDVSRSSVAVGDDANVERDSRSTGSTTSATEAAFEVASEPEATDLPLEPEQTTEAESTLKNAPSLDPSASDHGNSPTPTPTPTPAADSTPTPTLVTPTLSPPPTDVIARAEHESLVSKFEKSSRENVQLRDEVKKLHRELKGTDARG